MYYAVYDDRGRVLQIGQGEGIGVEISEEEYYRLLEEINQPEIFMPSSLSATINYLTNDAELTDIATAIRRKSGKTGSLEFPLEFIDAIDDIAELNPIIDGTVTSISGTAESIRPYCFNECFSLSVVDLPECNSLGLHAFDKCSVLTDVVLGLDALPAANSLSTVSTIERITLSSCTSIVAKAFASCSLLKEANLPVLSNLIADVLQNKKSLTSVRLDECKSLAANAFAGCNVLSDLYAPNVSYIGNTAFNGCSALADLDLPALTSYGASAFVGYTNPVNISFANLPRITAAFMDNRQQLETVYIPLLTDIAATAFRSCYSLKYADFPNVSVLRSNVFQNCSNLSYITMRDVSLISTNAFAGCISLTELSFNNLSYVGTNAFNKCTELSSIRLSTNTALTLYTGCFTNCSNLMDLYIDTPAIAVISGSTSATFNGTPFYASKIGSIHVPESLAETYKNNAKWKPMSDCIVGDL